MIIVEIVVIALIVLISVLFGYALGITRNRQNE